VPARRLFPAVALLILAAAAGAGFLATFSADPPATPTPPAVRAVPVAATATIPVALHPVRIRKPIQPPRVETGLLDARGHPVTTSCATCHATSKPRPENASAEQLDEFHQGLTYAHGNLTCLSCHHADNYDRLRLADGRAVEFPDALQLCAQCHGPQYRDYLHGSHGGMTGHWDLRRGPRDRNHCVDCHDPHAPAFPKVRPVFAPAPDRGLTSSHPAPAPAPAPSHP
jgi:hypothetical protein